MASAFSLSYSTIMYQAQRAPTPSLWTCSGWEMSFSPQHSDFSQGKNIASLWRSERCRFFVFYESFLCVALMLHFFTTQSRILFSGHCFLLCRLFSPCFTVCPHSLAPYVSAPYIMLNSLFPVLMLSFKCHQEFTCFVYGWSAPCRDYLHYKSNFHIFELVNYVQLHIPSIVPGASPLNAVICLFPEKIKYFCPVSISSSVDQRINEWHLRCCSVLHTLRITRWCHVHPLTLNAKVTCQQRGV